MHISASWFIFVLLIALSGCASKTIPGTGRSTTERPSDNSSYDEDLSAVRPTYELPAERKPEPGNRPAPKPEAPVTGEARKPAPPVPVSAVNRRLDMVLDTIAQQNRSIRYAPGYRIQIYVGNERQQAEAAKLQVYQSFPELSPYLSYKQPTYRLKVGDFVRRMDAERYLAQLRQQFSSALMQPDKVDIRRSLSIK